MGKSILWSIFEYTGLVEDYLEYVNQGKHSMKSAEVTSYESGDLNDWTDNVNGYGA